MNKKKTVFGLVFGALVLISLVAIGLNSLDTGFKLGNGNVMIDAHGIHRRVTNTGGEEYFIPTKTANEWSNFRTATGTISDLSLCTPVNGGWGSWGSWGSCSTECEGTQTRSRLCNNPTLTCGGLTCVGSSSESQSCGVCLGTCTAGTCVVPVPTYQLLAYYPFDGGSLSDVSSPAYNASTSGATTTSDRNGASNSAYNFDGTNDTMSSPITETELAANHGRDFSIAMWVRPEDWGTCTGPNNCSYAKPLVSNRYVTGLINHGINFSLLGIAGDVANSPVSASYNMHAGQISLTVGGGCNLDQIYTQSSVSLNTWTHVAMTMDYNSSNGHAIVKLYKNGSALPTNVFHARDCNPGAVTFNTSEISYTDYIASSYAMRMGNDHNANAYYYFDGQMDEIAIYDRTLSAAEVVDIYNSQN